MLLGGTIPLGPGAFYPPTVLSHIQSGMVAYQEELFGPVAALIKVADERRSESIRPMIPFLDWAQLFLPVISKKR